MNKNYSYFSQNVYYGNYDLVMGVTGRQMCTSSNGVHNVGLYGLASMLGTVTFLEMNDYVERASSYHTGNVRLMQHELSHNFGVHDVNNSDPSTKCTENSLCIMSGGWDYIEQYDLANIWCKKHADQLEYTLH